MARVFILGWDGATFDLIEPWVAQGKLPTIARLLERGAHGRLRSTLPPMTFPAWTSFMTGKNQAKHGIFDFMRRQPGKYDLEFVNGGQRHAPTIWELLSAAGRTVTAISIPCTYPPNRVNGVMISGFDAPGGGYVDARGMHPPELFKELEQHVGHHPISAPISQEINQDRPDLALEKILQTIRQKAATAKYLAQHRPWDCFMVLFGETDRGGHYYWKYCDPNSPLFLDHPTGVRDALLRIYQELDRQAGELLGLLPPDTTVLLMSDHGFGGASNCVLYPNCWLRQQGFLEFHGPARRAFTRALGRLKLRVQAVLPPRLEKLLYRLSRYGPGAFEARVRYGMIDWARTQVYFDETPYYPVLWVNLKGRQPKGTVEPGREYEQVRDRLIRELEAWRHPQTGAPVVEKAYRREEIYSGPYLEEAPDVLARWALHKGYNYAFRLSSKSRNLDWIEEVDPRLPHNLPYFTEKSGHHREEGVLVAQGPGVRAGARVQGARIIDLAPTILYLLGVPVPDDMDGRVLEAILAAGHTEQLPVQTASAAAVGVAAEEYAAYSAEDEEKISERLKSLGYLE